MAKSQADLDAAIKGLAVSVQATIEAELQPIIDALRAKTSTVAHVDFTPEIVALGFIGQTVSVGLKAHLTEKDPETGVAPLPADAGK